MSIINRAITDHGIWQLEIMITMEILAVKLNTVVTAGDGKKIDSDPDINLLEIGSYSHSLAERLLISAGLGSHKWF